MSSNKWLLQLHLIKIYSLIENNFDDYVYILKYFLNIVEEKPLLKLFINKERLSIGWDRQIVKKVYNKL